MGMCFGYLYCMLLLAEARYFSFYPLFPLGGPSVEIFRILVSSQRSSVFPEAALRCRGPGFHPAPAGHVACF